MTNPRISLQHRHPQGFTYLSVMFLVSVVSVSLAATVEVWHTAVQREKEQELLFVGDQFRLAIGRYHAAAGQPAQYPARLEDLLKDPRQPGIQRYLRRIYRDPVTGRAEWGLIRDADGGIIGVRSLSDMTPIKQSGFEPLYQNFGGSEAYSEWLFIHRPEQVPVWRGSLPLWTRNEAGRRMVTLGTER